MNHVLYLLLIRNAEFRYARTELVSWGGDLVDI